MLFSKERKGLTVVRRPGEHLTDSIKIHKMCFIVAYLN
jgi:hypothetical protein